MKKHLKNSIVHTLRKEPQKPKTSQNTAYYSTSMPWTVQSSRNTLGKFLMKLHKAVAFAQVNLTDKATPNSLRPVALVSLLLCLFTHTAVLFGTWKPLSCVWQRLGGGHFSLGHSLKAVTASYRVPFTLTEHIKAKIHMGFPFLQVGAGWWLWLQMIKELTMADCSNHQQMYCHHHTHGRPTG